VLGDDGAIREDFTPSEDDNVLVTSVAGDANGLGYFGYAYYAENEDQLNAVAINGVLPSPETIADGSYAPLSRPLFVYVNAEAMQDPALQEFMRFYLATAPEVAAEVGFVASPEEIYAEDNDKLEAAIAGDAEPDGPAGAAESTPEA
jgi:phosphate transport system substrate-binding protein